MSGPHSHGAGIDGIAPGTTFTWGDLIVYDEASQPAVIDGVTLDGAPADLQFVGAAAVPQFQGTPALMDFATVPAQYQETLAARPLLGSQIESASSAAWKRGVLVVFLLRLAHVGEIRVDSVTLAYHVGSDHYTATYPYALHACVGASVEASSPCPYASAAPTASATPGGGR